MLCDVINLSPSDFSSSSFYLHFSRSLTVYRNASDSSLHRFQDRKNSVKKKYSMISDKTYREIRMSRTDFEKRLEMVMGSSKDVIFPDEQIAKSTTMDRICKFFAAFFHFLDKRSNFCINTLFFISTEALYFKSLAAF